MPYDGEGRLIPSKADNSSDIIGFGDVGGIGQLIYHTFRFPEYEYEEAHDGYWCLKPIGMAELDKENGLPGKKIFEELYNLGLHINDFSSKKPFDQQIIDFCKRVSHPYFIDDLYATMTHPTFDYTREGQMLENDAMFSVSEFMRDLGSFYNAAQFYFAFKDVCSGDGEKAFNLAQEGKFFEGLPFFEKYKHEENFREYVTEYDEHLTPQELFAEMLAEAEKEGRKPREDVSWFAVEPADYDEEILNTLIDIIPTFQMRLKRNPKNNQVKLACDVHSVFDIAWYTLAMMITDFGPLEDGGRERDLSDGTLVTCPNCGEAFIRRNNRQQYCMKEECQKAHNALRQRRYRESQKIKKAQNKQK